MNGKAYTIPNPRSFVGIKHWKIRISSRQWRSRGRKPKWKKKKTESYVFSSFGNGISRGWERNSSAGRFATSRFWPCTWKISSVGKDQVHIREFCVMKVPPIIVSVAIQRIFSSWALPSRYFAIYFRSLIKSTFPYTYIYVWVCVCVCIYIYIYIYIYICIYINIYICIYIVYIYIYICIYIVSKGLLWLYDLWDKQTW